MPEQPQPLISPDLVNQIVQQINAGDLTICDQLREADYEMPPVSIRQFIEDPYYLGDFLCPDGEASYHENWKKFLDEAFFPGSRVVTLILTGAIGVGKDMTASIVTLYKVYRLLCLKDPAVHYGLSPGSRFVFGVFNVTLRKAETCYENMLKWVAGSPFFKTIEKQGRNDVIFFPKKNIRIETGSLAEHAIGENMFGFILNEANFFKQPKADKHAINRAHTLYNEARTRLISRFSRRGSSPGLIIIMSSRRFHTSFLEKQIEEAEKVAEAKEVTRVAQFALWDVKPTGTFPEEKFKVMIGDDKVPSRILEDEEIPPSGYCLVDVPDTEELRLEFKRDVEKSIRDFAGRSTYGTGRFFAPSMIQEAISDSRQSPMKVETITGLGVGLGNKIAEYIDWDRWTRTLRSKKVPRLNPTKPRVISVDIGLTHDALGLAMGHRYFDMELGRDVIYVDLAIRIRAPQGNEVDLNEIIDFFKMLRKNGFNISKITYDRFESRHSVQILKQLSFMAEQRSVTLEDYVLFKRLLADGVVDIYRYAPLITEMEELEMRADTRPGHPEPDGSDDVCDAVTSVIGQLGVGQVTDIEERGTDFEKRMSRLPFIMG